MVEHRLPKARAAGSNPVSRLSLRSSLTVCQRVFLLRGKRIWMYLFGFWMWLELSHFQSQVRWLAYERKMDLFGVCVLGVVTATGGGMTRDIVLGINPPRMFTNSTDVLIAAVTAILTFIVIHYANKKKQTHVGFREMYSLVLFIMDTLGLAIFTVIGIEVALATRPDASNFLLVFVGTITGVGGGLLRDMMSESIPYIFQKHIYATACIVGAVICVIFL